MKRVFLLPRDDFAGICLLRTQGASPRLCMHMPNTPQQFLCCSRVSLEVQVPLQLQLSPLSSPIRDSASPCRRSALTLVNLRCLTKTDDGWVIRATHSSHLYLICHTQVTLGSTCMWARLCSFSFVCIAGCWWHEMSSTFVSPQMTSELWCLLQLCYVAN